MDSPPRDDSASDSSSSTSDSSSSTSDSSSSTSDSSDSRSAPSSSTPESNDPTSKSNGSTPESDDSVPANDRATAAIDDSERGDTGTSGATYDDPLEDILPHADVDSRWWYWIAAIPLYVVVGFAFGVFFAVASLIGIGLDGGVIVIPVLFVFAIGFALVGLVLTLLFPVATYVDARAIADSEASWTPDPLVWGLAALATVVLSAFTLSFVLALYYLYRRHVAVGTS